MTSESKQKENLEAATAFGEWFHCIPAEDRIKDEVVLEIIQQSDSFEAETTGAIGVEADRPTCEARPGEVSGFRFKTD